jgi:hypothetical protein
MLIRSTVKIGVCSTGPEYGTFGNASALAWLCAASLAPDDYLEVHRSVGEDAGDGWRGVVRVIAGVPQDTPPPAEEPLQRIAVSLLGRK